MKKLVFDACVRLLQSRIDAVTATLADLKESAANETKSSVGDKYETGLAMLQQEQKNVQGQLQVLREQMSILRSLEFVGKNSTVVNGSLVLLNEQWYYVSVPIGKLVMEEGIVMVISSSSPLGRELMGKKISSEINFLNKRQLVRDIE